MFFDFSSAFNTIQPVLLWNKLQKTEDGCLHNHMDYWLPDRQTTVCETDWLCVWPGGQQHRSTTGDCSLTIPLHSVHPGLPVQVGVLSSAKILRWLCSISDGQETQYRNLGTSHVILNVNKTKEMSVDFRRTKSNSISIMGAEVEVVEKYKCLCSPGEQTGLEMQHRCCL